MHVDVSHGVSGRPESPAVILASSLGMTREMWKPQLVDLRGRYCLITYDYRGHGESPTPAGPYTMRQLGEDVLALMDRFSIETCHFLGLSLGGMVGMWLGIHAPERLERLALLCTFAHVPSPDVWSERAGLVRAEGTESVVQSSSERWFTPEFRAANSSIVDRHSSILSGIPAEGYAGCCEAIQTMDIEDDLGRIRAPTLVIAGSEDAGAPPETGKELASAIPGARYVEVPAAHLASVERPDLINPLLVEHLGSSGERLAFASDPSWPCAERRR